MTIGTIPNSSGASAANPTPSGSWEAPWSGSVAGSVLVGWGRECRISTHRVTSGAVGASALSPKAGGSGKLVRAVGHRGSGNDFESSLQADVLSDPKASSQNTDGNNREIKRTRYKQETGIGRDTAKRSDQQGRATAHNEAQNVIENGGTRTQARFQEIPRVSKTFQVFPRVSMSFQEF